MIKIYGLYNVNGDDVLIQNFKYSCINVLPSYASFPCENKNGNKLNFEVIFFTSSCNPFDLIISFS
jgi:hypothetical protein